MTNYVRQQSTGDIIRNSVIIYRKNFLSLFFIYFIPIFPLLILEQYAIHVGHQGLQMFTPILNIIIFLLVFPAFTVAISEVCLGNRATVIHSFQRVIKKGLGRFIGTYFLLLLLFIVGVILLAFTFFIIPIESLPSGSAGTLFIILVIAAILITIPYMFTLQVSVLERVFGIKALKRSKELGKGFYVRNFIITIFLYIIMYAAVLLIAGSVGFILGLICALFSLPLTTEPIGALFLRIVGGTIGQLVSPIPYIGIVLLYYDMRARKEAYDCSALAEDLMR